MNDDPAARALARVTLRAYRPAPARIELSYQPLPWRLCRTLLSLGVFWGAIPVLIWVPPHYPWVITAFVVGLFLAHRSWTGRYRVYPFAGVCPRCGHPISLGLDHAISLPHTLTCYHCHFEPSLEVSFDPTPVQPAPVTLEHGSPDCTGLWETRWLADVEFVICNRCYAGRTATPPLRDQAREENQQALLLARLAREGEFL